MHQAKICCVHTKYRIQNFQESWGTVTVTLFTFQKKCGLREVKYQVTKPVRGGPARQSGAKSLLSFRVAAIHLGMNE